VKNSNNIDQTGRLAVVKNEMASNCRFSITRFYVVARFSKAWVERNFFELLIQLAQVRVSLFNAPTLGRIDGYGFQILFSGDGEAEVAH